LLVNIKEGKAVVEYPCRWLYKVISLDYLLDRQRIVSMLQDCNCEITISNSSREGKYTCLNVEVEVESEVQRNSIFQALQDLDTVRVVL
jgi:putative lipoic acid-binding regulatory protein